MGRMNMMGELGDWEMSVRSLVVSYGEMEKDVCPNVLQPFIENIDKRRHNDGSRKLIPIFHGPLRKDRSSPPAMALTLKYLVRVLT